ncbi:uncharacterized protein [Montipora foliosa]|uniref:uncharacterized protein n=1 Tax=Montipora foliosa TaxID=591990 RepID=UPI0035F203E8
MSPRSLLPITNADLTEEARSPENERRLHKSEGDFPLNLPCVMRQSVNLLICHRRQKIFVYTVLSAVTFATIIVLLYCLPKSLNPLKPFSLLFARVPRSSKLVNEHDKQKRYRDYDNSVVFDHIWLSYSCVGTLNQIGGIENIFEVVEAWESSLRTDCRDLYMKFRDIYLVRTRRAPVVIPESFVPKVLRWLGGNKKLLEGTTSQLITSIDNLYTQESTIFNPVRSKRPGAGGRATLETRQYLSEILQATAKDCDFCQYKNNTAQDPFGRIDSRFTVTVSNTFKVEKFHSLVLWKHHNPLVISEYELLDAMETAERWFLRAHAWDTKYTIPHVFWDTLPRASTSQIHPHLHVTLARDQYYARWNHLYFAAKKYAEDHNGENYFSALTEIHSALGLAVHYGSASVLAYLTPTASHEIMLLSKTLSKDLSVLLYACITALRDNMELYALSSGMVFPKLVPSPDGSDLPAIIRIVYRGAAESNRADIDSFQLFGTVNVNVDPYMIIRSIRKSVASRKERGL